jgi:cbb3-type cytochrome oxidase cytochrome c subunit
MKGLLPLFIGLFGTFTFSWVGLIVIPNMQIGHLDPQSDEEGTDIYPTPKSGMVERGLRVYAANGCIYCHSQQVRPDYAASDIDRKWGQRRSAPRDYLFDRPVQLGRERMGPDLANVAKRGPATEETPGAAATAPPSSPANTPGAPQGSPASATSPAATGAPPVATANASPVNSPSPSPAGESPPYSAAWHHRHLYSPRSINDDSNMPAYRFLYEKRLIDGEGSADALQVTGTDAPPAGWEIVPTYDATCLVAYLMSLDQSHSLKEVKTAAAAPAASPGASPAPAKGTK